MTRLRQGARIAHGEIMKDNEGLSKDRSNGSIEKRINVKYLWQVEYSGFSYQKLEVKEQQKLRSKITFGLPNWMHNSLFRDRKNRMRSRFLLELRCVKGQITHYRAYYLAMSSGEHQQAICGIASRKSRCMGALSLRILWRDMLGLEYSWILHMAEFQWRWCDLLRLFMLVQSWEQLYGVGGKYLGGRS